MRGIVDLVGDARREFPQRGEFFRLNDLLLRVLFQEVVALDYRRHHGIEGLAEIPQLVLGVDGDLDGVVALGDFLRRVDQDVDRVQEVLDEVNRKTDGDEQGYDDDDQEQDGGFFLDVVELVLDDADIENADHLAMQIVDRAVGRNIPVVDHEGLVEPQLPALEHLLVNLLRYARSNGAYSVLPQDVG